MARTEFVGFGIPGPQGPKGDPGTLVEDPLTPNHGGTGLTHAAVAASTGAAPVTQGDGTFALVPVPTVAAVAANTTAIASLVSEVATFAPAGVTAFNVPNCLEWETVVSPGLGIIPFARTSVARIGAFLWGFGGNVGGSASAKIFRAPYDATGVTPSWIDTGFTLPHAVDQARVAIIGAYVYIFGDDSNSDAGNIYRASLSNPTTWTTVGSLGTNRFNAPLVVSNGKIMIVKGSDGGPALGTILSAPVSAPTGTWTVSTIAGGSSSGPAIACGAYASSDVIYALGGIGDERNMAYAPIASLSDIHSVSTVFPTNVAASPAVFNLGHEVVLVGANTTQGVLRGQPDAPHLPWQGFNSPFPVACAFVWTSNWIGGDGRAYVITGGGMYRSKLHTVLVPNGDIDATKPYATLDGTLTTGGYGCVSTHVRMGMAPWQTDRSGLSAAF